jgi:hypothetical protein
MAQMKRQCWTLPDPAQLQATYRQKTITKAQVCGALQTFAGSVQPHVVLVNGETEQCNRTLMQR